MNTVKMTIVLFVMLHSMGLSAQMPVSPANEDPRRSFVADPFRIIGNIYFVGTNVQNASYLVTGSEGHILFDTVYEDSPAAIARNIETLGFDPRDVKLIIGTHAHNDHVAGHALMQKMTGATIAASQRDRKTIESGGGGAWPPAVVDRVLQDGEMVRLGDISVTVHMTPGHTPGTMTFTTVAEEEGNTFDVVLLGGVRMTSLPLLGNPDYPELASDLAETFKTLKSLPVDIYLGGHGYWYNLYEKIERMKAGEGYKAFIDPEGYRAAIDGWQQAYIDQLVTEGGALLTR